MSDLAQALRDMATYDCGFEEQSDTVIAAADTIDRLTAELAEYKSTELTANEYRESVGFVLSLNKAIKQATGKTALDWEQLEAQNAELLQKTQQLEQQNAKLTERWTSVIDALPSERGYYLACVQRTASEDLGGNETRIRIMRWMGEDWRYAYHIPEWINAAVTDMVTHWMPLPEPPKDKQEAHHD